MPQQSLQTDCCIVGGGPAGLMLGLLLARAGVDVIVLEKHEDFFRDFRGDTIHPSTIDLLDQLGLRQRFDAIPQSQIRTLDLVVNGNRLTPIDFSTLHGANRSIALMPQWDFLNLLANEASRYPTFRLLMGTEAIAVRYGPADAGGRRPVIGVSAHEHRQAVEITAALTVGADGRDSAVCRSAGLVPVDYGVAIDVLWFRLPKPASPPPDTLAYLNAESMVITIPRSDYYQAGMLIPKGDYLRMQAEGLDAFRARIVRAAPFLAPVVDALHAWDQVKLLSVQVNRLPTWWAPGVLCLGDAAHAMSPAFGVGVNYAIQDAVVAARILAAPLRETSVSTDQLEQVQKRRERPVRLMQPLQIQLHKLIARPGGGGFLRHPMPWWQRIPVAALMPVVRRVAARVVGRGFRPERLDGELLRPRRR